MKMCRCKYLRYIQTLSFAVHETVLYLDGHPCDKGALEYYRKNNALLKEAVSDYESKFGPLTYNGSCNAEEWTWYKGPWPWKYEANVCEK